MHSDKKPKLKDDVTGLAAFDDLDPVSAVSELNLFPEVQAGQLPAAQPQLHSRTNTLPPARFAPSAPPPPVPQQAHSTSPAQQQDHATPAAQQQAHSAPPSGPAHSVDPDPQQPYAFDDEEEATGYYDRDPDGSQPGQTSAALSMEWEEEEPETRLRPGDTIDHAAGAPFTAVSGGNPSPFPSDPAAMAAGQQPQYASQPAAQQYAGQPVAQQYVSQPVAQQYVSQPVASTAPAMLPVEPVADEDWPEEKRGGSKLAIAGVILALAVVAQLVVWQMGDGDPGVATLVTTPANAQVTVDGVAATTSHSPFILELSAGEKHEIVIARKGYVSQTLPVSIEAGARLELPAVDLASEGGITGFALSSAPVGATVFIDGANTGKKTPVEFTDIEPGMHTIRLEAEAGSRVFELQVFVVEDKVLELPEATLTEAKGQAAVEKTVAEKSVVEKAADEKPSKVGTKTTTKKAKVARKSERKPRRVRKSSTSGARARARVAPAKRATRRKAVAERTKAVATRAGGTGTLRINTRPWSAISVDGKKVGNTPQLNLQLSAGTHKIRLTNPQMGLSKTIRVKIKKDRTTTKILNLIE